jgi:hypothetical protein
LHHRLENQAAILDLVMLPWAMQSQIILCVVLVLAPALLCMGLPAQQLISAITEQNQVAYHTAQNTIKHAACGARSW